MSYKNLDEFIGVLDKTDELLRIKTAVDPILEMTEIADRISKQPGGGKALLFENTGTDFPVLMNAFGSDKRMALALNVASVDMIGEEMAELFKDLTNPQYGFFNKLKLLPKVGQMAGWMPKTISPKHPACQEVSYLSPDLDILPILKCWPQDGGRFITLPVVHTLDPESGIRNVGMYRMQVFENNLSAMHWHKHKVAARHFEAYKHLGKKMPIAVTLGGDPAYTYVATAPLPDNLDEYMLAGFLRKQRVELVKCLTQDIEVPADADIVIEGYVDTQEDFIWEGPFGDHTGFYSLADWYPRFHVTCITHRKDAVYPATVVGIPPMEDAYLAKATERIFLMPLKMMLVNELEDMHLPPEGVAHNLTTVSIKKSFAGQAVKVANALWGAGQMMFNKLLVVSDQHVKLEDYKALAQAISTHVDPIQDITIQQGPLDVLDHAAEHFAYGGKLLFDATKKYPEELRTGQLIANNVYNLTIDCERLKETAPAIKQINTALLEQGISAIILGIEKTESALNLGETLLQSSLLNGVKFIVLMDDVVDIEDISMVLWVGANHFDPKRDSRIVAPKSPESISHLIIDGTRKTPKADHIHRDWPNVITMNQATIEHVDKQWANYALGDRISSPSLRYQKLKVGNKAVVK